jgi:hypothetical protein
MTSRDDAAAACRSAVDVDIQTDDPRVPAIRLAHVSHQENEWHRACVEASVRL